MSKNTYVKEKNIIKIKSTIMEHIVDIFQILWGSVRNTSILLGAQMILQDKKVMPLKRFILNLYHHTN